MHVSIIVMTNPLTQVFVLRFEKTAFFFFFSNTYLQMITVGLASSTVVAGFFGMNLLSGFEAQAAPNLFWPGKEGRKEGRNEPLRSERCRRCIG